MNKITHDRPKVFDKRQIEGNVGIENLLAEPAFFQLGKGRIRMWFIDENPAEAREGNKDWDFNKLPLASRATTFRCMTAFYYDSSRAISSKASAFCTVICWRSQEINPRLSN